MSAVQQISLPAFLFLLFLGTICNSMTIPFMGYFLVEELGYQPRIISLYSVLALVLTLLANRLFGERIDHGKNVFPLIGIAALGALLASLALAISPTLWTTLSIGVLGFGISSSVISTMFSLGGSLAENNGIKRSSCNAYMRATTSTAWMFGPAVTFLLADQLNTQTVFLTAFGISVLWICVWWRVLPHHISTPMASVISEADSRNGVANGLWMAAIFVFCLSFAHSLTFTSLPLFYVQEVGLPGYAPGIAFSMKTFIEIFAVFSTPVIIERFGMRKALLVTTLIAVGTIQFLSSIDSFTQMLIGAALEGLYYGLFASLGISYVQSFAPDRPARATAIYWNTLLASGLLAGPAVGFIAQATSFQTVVQAAVGMALIAVIVLAFGTAGKSTQQD